MRDFRVTKNELPMPWNASCEVLNRGHYGQFLVSVDMSVDFPFFLECTLASEGLEAEGVLTAICNVDSDIPFTHSLSDRRQISSGERECRLKVFQYSH